MGRPLVWWGPILKRPVSLCPGGKAGEYLRPSGGGDCGASVPKSKRRVRLTHRKQEESLRGVGRGRRKVLGQVEEAAGIWLRQPGASRILEAMRTEDSVWRPRVEKRKH